MFTRPEALIDRLPDCLHWSPDGEIRVVGHRIGLYHLIYYYNEGYSAEMLLCQYPTLELVVIHKVIVFYLENREEVDAYVAAYQADLDRLAQRAIMHPAWPNYGRGLKHVNAR